MIIERVKPARREIGSQQAVARELAGELFASPRDELLGAVRAIAPLLEEGAAQSDREGRLREEAVQALRSHGFWRMRLCREVGGFELSIVAQIEVLAALAEIDASSAWCTMVANHAVAVVGATMPQAAVDRIFAEGVPCCSIVAATGGTAKAKDGGYILNGTWRLASSISHADWVHASAYVDGDPSRLLPLAIPARDVDLLDTWNVVGLGGTGSYDFKLTDYFLPAELVGREDNPYGQVRGTRRYDLADLEHIESYEHLALALGLGRRALRELRLVLSKPVQGRYVCDREVVQERLGRLILQLQSVEALSYQIFARIDAAAMRQSQRWSETDRYLPRALAARTTEIALECVHFAFHRSGLVALHSPNIFEKLLRDMSVAATHVAVDDSAFSTYAQHLIETGAPLGLTIQSSSTGSRAK